MGRRDIVPVLVHLPHLGVEEQEPGHAGPGLGVIRCICGQMGCDERMAEPVPGEDIGAASEEEYRESVDRRQEGQ